MSASVHLLLDVTYAASASITAGTSGSGRLMRFLSLFSGIGGMDLGLERAGWQCVGQCEIEPFCQAVLEYHWPDVWRWQDVKTLTGQLIRERCGHVDAVVGGPPCQPASVAGQRKGASDDRWMWPDFLRVVSEVKPVWVLAENPRGVASLRVEGMQFGEWLAREFETKGYELLPVKLAAEDAGAPHRRERVWFVAYCPRNGRREGRPESARIERRLDAAVCGEAMGYATSAGLSITGQARERQFSTQTSERLHDRPELASADGVGLADTISTGLEGQRNGAIGAGAEVALPAGFSGYRWPARPGESQHEWEDSRTATLAEIESSLGLATDGSAARLARYWRRRSLKAIGNAVVPQCAEAIGRAILAADTRRKQGV